MIAAMAIAALLAETPLGLPVAGVAAQGDTAQTQTRALEMALAASPAALPPLIAKVVYEVDEIYSERQLRSAVVLREGRRLWPADVTASVRNIWLTRAYMPDIQVYVDGPADGATVHVVLERRPYIKKIRVHGGTSVLRLPRWLTPGSPRVTKRQITRAVALRRLEAFDQTDLDRSVQSVKDLLRREGFYQAAISTRVRRERKAVTIDLFVKLGPPAKLDQIEIATLPGQEESAKELQAELRDEIGLRFDRPHFVRQLDGIRKRYGLKGYFRPTLALQDVRETTPTSVTAVVQFDLGPSMELDVVRSAGTPLPKAWSLADLPLYESLWSKIIGNVYAKLLPIWDDRSIELPTLQRGEANLERYYRSKGYAEAEVHATSTLRGKTNRATIEVQIDAGDRFHIDKLDVEGNQALSTKEIREALESTSRGLFSKGLYDPDRVAEDLKRIRALYRRAGYHSASVNFLAEFVGPSVHLTFLIQEGIRTVVSAVRVEGNEILSTDELLSRLPFHTGDAFVPDRVIDGQYQIFALYTDRGFSSTVVEIEAPVPLQRTLIDPPWPEAVEVRYRLYEGELAVFGPTIIRGLDRARRWVVLKELAYSRGEPFDVKKLYESASRVRQLGLFNVKYFNRIDEEGPLKTILVDVDELPAGTLGLGFGFTGRSEGELLNFVPLNKVSADFLYRNLGGYGALVGLAADVSFDRQLYRFKLGHPHLGFENLTLDLSLSADNDKKTVTDEDVTTSYNVRDLGGTLTIGRRLSRTNRVNVSYRYSDKKLSDLDTGDFIEPDDVGTERVSSLGAGYSLDSRDLPFAPTAGLFGQASFEVALTSIGSSDDFLKFISQVSYYKQPRKGHVIAAALRVGLATNLPFSELFTIGGYSTLRGFPDEIGAGTTSTVPLPPGTQLPPDEVVAVGGNAQVLYNIEYRFPLLFGLAGQVWTDLGNVWSQVEDFRPWDLNKGLGLGLRYDTPIGPFRFDIGWGFDEDFQYESWDYYFVIGHPF